MKVHFLHCPQCSQKYSLPPQYQQNRTYPCQQCGSPLKLRQVHRKKSGSQGETQGGETVGEEITGGGRENQTTASVPGWAEDPEFIAPQTRAAYPVIGVLGEGGWGKVYKVKDPVLKRSLALKILKKRRGGSHSQQRFIREIYVTANLEHPNIMPVYEGGSLQDGSFYMLMKEIRGRTLRDYLREEEEGKRKRNLRESLEIFLKVCRAVDYAHSRGIIHRDLKPSNVALGNYGEVIVMDWGLAKFLKEEEEKKKPKWMEGNLENNLYQDISLDGDMIGTPAYMPPEQANGQHDLVGKRSDIYSLGAMMYHILALSPPFTGSVQYIITSLLMQDPLPPRKKKPTLKIPKALSAITMKAMAREIEDRYGAVKDLIRDVETYLDDEVPSVYEPPFTEKMQKFLGRHAGLLLVLIFILFVLSLSGYFMNYLNRKRLKEERDKLRVQKQKEALYEKNLQAERERLKARKKAGEERKKKIEAQRQLIAAQKKREAYMKRIVKAYGPFVLAQSHFQRNMRFESLKKVVIPQLEKALEINPDFVQARWMLIRVNILLKRRKETTNQLIQILQIIARREKNDRLNQLLYQAVMNPREVTANPEFLKELDQQRPADLPPTLWGLLKVELLSKGERYQKALEVVNEITSNKEGRTWDIYLLKVGILKDLNRFDEALALCEKILRDYPHALLARISKVRLLFKVKRYKEVHKMLRRLALWDPTNHIVWEDFARLYRVRQYQHPKNSDLALSHAMTTYRYAARVKELEGSFESSDRYLKTSQDFLLKRVGFSTKASLRSTEVLRKLYQRAKKSSSQRLRREFSLLLVSLDPPPLPMDAPPFKFAGKYIDENREKLKKSVDAPWLN